MRKNFLITESERKNILRMYGLISEQTPVQTTTGSTQQQIPSDYELQDIILGPELGYPYKILKYSNNTLTGIFHFDKRPDPNTKKEVITPSNKLYNQLMKFVYNQYNEQSQEDKKAEEQKQNSKLIDGYDRYGEPKKVDIQNLTTEDLNIIYKYTKEYHTAFENFRKTNPGDRFCAGDTWDINLYPQGPEQIEKIKKCGSPSFDPKPISKVSDKTSKYGIVEMVNFMIKNPSDQRAIDLKKRLGINEQPATQSSGNLMQHKIYNPENEQ